MEAKISNTFDVGFTWVVQEPMERASHAIAIDGKVWLIDPVAWEPALDRAAALGEPAGVIQLLDRHRRDCAELAHRLGVRLHVLPDELPGTPLLTQRLIDRRWWHERVVWWPEQQLLIVPEALGTASYFALGRPLGVHPLLRLTPPYSLRQYAPTSILVGHGPSVHADADGAMEQALQQARSDIPRAIMQLPRTVARRR